MLQANGRWHNKAHGKTTVRVKHYKTTACQHCRMKERCTRNPEGRLIERSEYSPNIEANARRVKANEATYRRRQAIIEHTYGIIKRQWDFYYITTKKP